MFLANKARYKGWRAEFQRMKQSLDMLIMGTPTSELRNKLTVLQLYMMEIEQFDKQQKEVL